MRSSKYLVVIMVIFALVLGACSSGGSQQTQSPYPLGTDTTGLGNENLNSNGNLNGNLNGNGNTAETPSGTGMGTATSTTSGMATPLGTAMGTPAATKAPTRAATTAAPMTTATQGTPMATQAAGQGTPMATQPAAGGNAQTYENGILVSNLIGANIQNANGDDLGEVDSVILNQANCTVPYLLVRVNADQLAAPAAGTPAAGGTNANANGNGNTNANANGNANANSNGNANGNGNTNANANGNANANTAGTKTPATGASQGSKAGDLVLVPLSAFFADGQKGVVTLPLTLNEKAITLLTKAPRYTEQTLPNWAAPTWNEGLNTAWPGFTVSTGAATGGTNANGNGNANSNANASGGTNTNGNTNANTNAAGATMTHGTGAVRITDISKVKVTNANGDDLGKVQDMLVMLNNQPSYLFLGVGGFLGIGEKLIPMPCDRAVFKMDGSGNLMIVVNADKQTLQNAPTIDDIPTAFDQGWNTSYESYWTSIP